MRWLPLLFVLFGCAALKPLPEQSLDCLDKQAPGLLADAAQALATHETPDEMKASLGAEALGALWCIAQAAYSDLHTAHQVAEANGVAVETVQAHAKMFLQAKPAPTNP